MSWPRFYGVGTRVLVQAVKRNLARFPADFIFQPSAEEWSALGSESVISSDRGGQRYAPYVFTEQGAAMPFSMLGSARAGNIETIRTFFKARGLAATHQDLAKSLGELEEKTELLLMRHETFSRNARIQLKQVFDACAS